MTPSFDVVGNRISKRLTGLTATGQANQTFDYDALGRLVKKTAGGTAAYFLWDGEHLLAKLGSPGTAVFR